MIINDQNYFLLEKDSLYYNESLKYFERKIDYYGFDSINQIKALIVVRENKSQPDFKFPIHVFSKSSLIECQRIKISKESILRMDLNIQGQISTKDYVYKYFGSENSFHFLQIRRGISKDGVKTIGGAILDINKNDFSDELYKKIIGEKDLILFFQMLTFLKYTDPEIKILEAGRGIGSKKHGVLNRSKQNLSFVLVNENWNKEIRREEGFNVKGHYRLQPHGIGNKDTKLIWINPFEKNGYVMKAKGKSENNATTK